MVRKNIGGEDTADIQNTEYKARLVRYLEVLPMARVFYAWIGTIDIDIAWSEQEVPVSRAPELITAIILDVSREMLNDNNNGVYEEWAFTKHTAVVAATIPEILRPCDLVFFLRHISVGVCNDTSTKLSI